LRAHAQGTARPVAIAGEIVAGNVNLAFVGSKKTVTHSQCRGLARPIGSKQPQHFTGATSQIDAVHNTLAAKGFNQTSRCQQDLAPNAC
jgi:hypothetical protein